MGKTIRGFNGQPSEPDYPLPADLPFSVAPTQDNGARAAVEALTTWPRVQWFAYDAQVRGVPVNPTEDRVVVDRAAVLAIIDRFLPDAAELDRLRRIESAARDVVRPAKGIGREARAAVFNERLAALRVALDLSKLDYPKHYDHRRGCSRTHPATFPCDTGTPTAATIAFRAALAALLAIAAALAWHLSRPTVTLRVRWTEPYDLEEPVALFV